MVLSTSNFSYVSTCRVKQGEVIARPVDEFMNKGDCVQRLTLLLDDEHSVHSVPSHELPSLQCELSR